MEASRLQKSSCRFWRNREKGLKKMMDTKANAAQVVSGDQNNGKGEVLRMKILVKKEDLGCVLEAIRANRGKSNDIESDISSSLYLEECINVMKRRRVLRASNVKLSCHNDSSWRPALYSIPE